MRIERQPGLTSEAFDNHHAQLEREHGQVTRIHRYTQVFPLANSAVQAALQQGQGAESADYNGCTQL